jgi:hypothetical protein
MLASDQGDEEMRSSGKSQQWKSSDIEITDCCRIRLGTDVCGRLLIEFGKGV